jgi:hypothetical protein
LICSGILAEDYSPLAQNRRVANANYKPFSLNTLTAQKGPRLIFSSQVAAEQNDFWVVAQFEINPGAQAQVSEFKTIQTAPLPIVAKSC